jgi:hypothetical protein
LSRFELGDYGLAGSDRCELFADVGREVRPNAPAITGGGAAEAKAGGGRLACLEGVEMDIDQLEELLGLDR